VCFSLRMRESHRLLMQSTGGEHDEGETLPPKEKG
jgi:hypothetical protein